MIIGIDASRAALEKKTGTERYAFEVIKVLARYANQQQRLRLYTPIKPKGEWFDAPSIETRIIPFPRLWTHIRLAAEILHHPPDVLFIPAHVLPLICPVPAVVTVHDLGYRHFPEAHTRFQRWYLENTTRRHARVAAHIIADSAATATDLKRFYVTPPEKISVVHLGLSPNLAPVANPQPVVEKYGIRGKYLLYVGTLQPRKNLARVLGAFREILDSFPDVTLVLAGGKGWLFEQIAAEISRLQLTNRVILPGFIPEADKPALLSGATAFLFPSLYEGFGLPALEAMACGTPVLASNVSSLPEVVGEAAVLVSPTDTAAIAGGMRQLLADATLRKTLVARGYQQAAQFSWEKTGQQIWEILIQAAR